MMHALIGWLGLHFFVFTPEGVGMAVLVACITQAVDQIRIKKEKRDAVDSLPEKERAAAVKELEANIKSILAKTYIQNVLIYSVVVLVTAYLARSYGWL